LDEVRYVLRNRHWHVLDREMSRIGKVQLRVRHVAKVGPAPSGYECRIVPAELKYRLSLNSIAQRYGSRAASQAGGGARSTPALTTIRGSPFLLRKITEIPAPLVSASKIF